MYICFLVSKLRMKVSHDYGTCKKLETLVRLKIFFQFLRELNPKKMFRFQYEAIAKTT